MTQTQPDVSFIVAAYNAEETLAKAIDSALAQEGVSVEVIVADDCSTDETRTIAESYANRGVKLLALGRNGGPAAARNAALLAATGAIGCNFEDQVAFLKQIPGVIAGVFIPSDAQVGKTEGVEPPTDFPHVEIPVADGTKIRDVISSKEADVIIENPTDNVCIHKFENL